MNLTKNVVLQHATTAGSVGTSRSCSVVDMANAQGLAIIVPVEDTDASTDASITIRWRVGATTSVQNATTGSGYLTQTTTATTVADDMLFTLDSYHFNHRYVQAVIDGSSTNSIGTAIYIKYGLREKDAQTTAADGVYQGVVTAGPTTA